MPTENVEDAQKEGNELFLDVCESFRYGVMSYGSEQATPREVLIQREIMAIKVWLANGYGRADLPVIALRK